MRCMYERREDDASPRGWVAAPLASQCAMLLPCYHWHGCARTACALLSFLFPSFPALLRNEHLDAASQAFETARTASRKTDGARRGWTRTNPMLWKPMTGSRAKLWSLPSLPFGKFTSAYLQRCRHWPRPSDRERVRSPRMHVRWSPPLGHLRLVTFAKYIISGLDRENRRRSGCTDVAGNRSAPTSFPSQGLGVAAITTFSHLDTPTSEARFHH